LSGAGAWGIGVALDAGGGIESSTGWLVAFLVMAVGGLFGPLALLWSLRPSRARRPREVRFFR
ncbi:MAG: MFS transporter, partial [Terriglobia bacterium]